MEIVINCTKVNGTVVRIPYEVLETAKQGLSDDTDDDDSYDQQGAMQYIVATILVYSVLGVFCTLINRIRRLRGKTHENYVHDESISKYLKKERMLKMDGRKMKLMYECSLIEDKVKRFEERQKLLELEKELSSDFTKESTSEGRKKKKYRKKKQDIGSALGKMGASLFFIGSHSSLNINNKKHGENDNNDDDKVSEEIPGPAEVSKSYVVDIEAGTHDEPVTEPLFTSVIGGNRDNTDVSNVTNPTYLPYRCSDL